jgi:hypothetical protein
VIFETLAPRDGGIGNWRSDISEPDAGMNSGSGSDNAACEAENEPKPIFTLR